MKSLFNILKGLSIPLLGASFGTLCFVYYQTKNTDVLVPLIIIGFFSAILAVTLSLDFAIKEVSSTEGTPKPTGYQPTGIQFRYLCPVCSNRPSVRGLDSSYCDKCICEVSPGFVPDVKKIEYLLDVQRKYLTENSPPGNTKEAKFYIPVYFHDQVKCTDHPDPVGKPGDPGVHM